MSLRIAYVASAVEGLEAFVYREIEALRARGHDVLVLTTKHKPGDPFNPPADWPWARLRPVRAALRAPFRLLGPAGKLLGDARRHGALAELAAAIEFLPAAKVWTFYEFLVWTPRGAASRASPCPRPPPRLESRPPLSDRRYRGLPTREIEEEL